MSLTGGSGGVFSDQTSLSFTATNGLTSTYHLYAASLPTNQPLGLLVYLHDDGAVEFDTPTSTAVLGGTSGLVTRARAHRLITLPVRAPDTAAPVTWWEAGSPNSDYLRDLITYIYGRYNIDKTNIWLVGYSGGAAQVTEYFVPRHSSLIEGGGSVAFAGGGRPTIAVNPFAATFKSGYHMHWHIGANDNGTQTPDGYDALTDGTAGRTYYTGQGFATSLTSPAGQGRDLTGLIGNLVDAQLVLYSRFNTPTGGGGVAIPTTLTTSITAGVTTGHIGSHAKLHTDRNADGKTPTLPTVLTAGVSDHHLHHDYMKPWYDEKHVGAELPAYTNDSGHGNIHALLHTWDNAGRPTVTTGTTPPPAAPTIVTPVAMAPSRIRVMFTAPAGDSPTYKIYRGSTLAVTITGALATSNLDTVIKKEIAQEIVCTAENSSLDWRAQYSYLEDIGDGRGYTGGIIGFTSGTHDMLLLVQLYNSRKPGNVLQPYTQALINVDGTDSHTGLGSGFEAAWATAAADPVFRECQDSERDRVYFNPAVAAGKADGVRALGQFIYYDTYVNHGPGNDQDSFDGIRATAKSRATHPAAGGNETTYLNTFVQARKESLQRWGYTEFTRTLAQNKLINDGKFTLMPPLSWNLYGDDFTIAGQPWVDEGRSGATSYSYSVSAVNAAGVESARSSTASATTPAGATGGGGTTPPPPTGGSNYTVGYAGTIPSSAVNFTGTTGAQLEAAIAALPINGWLKVSSANITGDVTLTGSQIKDGITICNAPGVKPRITGLVDMSDGDGWHWYGIDVINPSGGATTHMVKFDGGSNWEVAYSQFYNAKCYTLVRPGQGCTGWRIHHCRVSDNKTANDLNQDHAFYVSSENANQNGRIDHCLIELTPNGRGVKVGGPSSGGPAIGGVLIDHNTIHDCTGPSAVQVSNGATNITVTYNVIYRCGNPSLTDGAGSGPGSSYSNNAYDVAGENTSNFSAGSGNVIRTVAQLSDWAAMGAAGYGHLA